MPYVAVLLCSYIIKMSGMPLMGRVIELIGDQVLLMNRSLRRAPLSFICIAETGPPLLGIKGLLVYSNQ